MTILSLPDYGFILRRLRLITTKI